MFSHDVAQMFSPSTQPVTFFTQLTVTWSCFHNIGFNKTKEEQQWTITRRFKISNSPEYSLYHFPETSSIWATSWENLSSDVSDQVTLKSACSATEIKYKLEILNLASKGIILANNKGADQIVQMHRLANAQAGRCTGWSVPLLFA